MSFKNETKNKIRLALAAIMAVVGVTSAVYAATFFRITAHNAPPQTIDAYGLCKNITNNNNSDIFVPLNTQSEWQSFVDRAPNVSLADCGVLGCTDPSASNYNPSATLNDGSCTYVATCPARTAWAACPVQLPASNAGDSYVFESVECGGGGYGLIADCDGAPAGFDGDGWHFQSL